MIQRRVFVFWFGPKMTLTRRRAFWLLRRRAQVPIQLVGPGNLQDWILKKQPLHPTFRYLSSTHQSDYLRAYFMLNYGGGYSDVKPLTFDWTPFFRTLDSSRYQFVGYPEFGPDGVAGGPQVAENWSQLAGACYYIFRPRSAFAREWLHRIHNILDEMQPKLLKHPGNFHPRAVRGGVFQPKTAQEKQMRSEYPLEWTQINGSIFHPLQLDFIGEFGRELPQVRWRRYR